MLTLNGGMPEGDVPDLRKEVERFRQRSDAYTEHDSGEWETEYHNWPALWDAAEAALQRVPDADIIELLLYALARDNECERICDMLMTQPAVGLEIARAAPVYADPDARWQIAVFLGRQGSPEAIDLLRRLVADSHEYVRRRALLAIAPLDAAYAESVAYSWLENSEEYSRLAALIVLDEVDSPLLTEALTRLRSDSVPFVRDRVEAIEARRREG